MPLNNLLWLSQNSPRFLSPLDATNSEGPIVKQFIEGQCKIVKESIGGSVGELIQLRDWQTDLINCIFALDLNGHRVHRTALIGIARKNGKSALMAGIAIYEFALGDPGGEIIICAKDSQQAQIIFTTCLQMLQRNELLRDSYHKSRDLLTNKSTGTILKVISRDALSAEGLSPTLAIVDELHAHPDDSLFNVLQEGKGARKQPLLVAITTAGARTDRFGRDSICYRLYQHGRKVATGEVEDPTFFFAWWEPLLGDRADHTDPEVWAEANPGLGDIVSIESFEDSILRTPEPEFRTKRTNQWVSSLNSALPAGVWERLYSDQPIEPGTDVILGFDGAISNDSTALTICTLDGHLGIVGLWERPINNDDPDWRIDSEEVLQTIRDACSQWNVLELAFDPAYWTHEMDRLDREGINAVAFPMSATRMVPAWDSFYSAAMAHEISHNGDAGLTRHMDNLVLKVTPTGAFPTKETKNSKRKIDASIAAIIAYDRARWHRANVKPERTWIAL